ncbi:exosome complex component RRP46 [Biomphalaria pfeifferi]|uniref:Exosome complex component RRP46 n=1 Tax=Biomphalaria pfeifferi TaxID=112525 RepID=A0AAD8B709_BIOPF|nr:exosome complex component RRP46 [Biomphalaria pfeifferi]
MATAFKVVRKEDLEAQQNAESCQTLRCLTSELGCLTRSDGSVSFSQGDTTVLAVSYGPAEVRINQEQYDKATVEVVYKPKVGLPRPIDRKREAIVKSTLEAAIVTSLHPRSSISIIIQETEDLGSNMACCINAACLALLDAAVHMAFMVAAVAVSVMEDGQIKLDPNKKEELEGRATLTFVFDSADLKVVSVVTSGTFSQEEYKKSIDLTRLAAERVFQFYRDSLSKKLMQSI